MVIMLGFIMFNTVPAPNQTPEPAPEEEGRDKQAAETDDERQVGCEVENQEKSQTDSGGKSLPAENGHGWVLSSVKIEMPKMSGRSLNSVGVSGIIVK
ncbi:hypothetical protein Q7C36_015400 [Tachysurus vachellii]|uniref:Uncharacterized protein n=1 Tax=Tachysurus vachellii TaxID=175792 RepID=A0AA88MDX7_TACVA|nr:hypothetical protein Q7C36_015400 [Tachysurus vachellii]